jgi:hypothetical protein
LDDDDLWTATKHRQTETRLVIARTSHRNVVTARPAKFLFSGLIRCGECGGPYVVYNRERLACSRHRDRGICGNALTIRRDELERRVLRAFRERLWDDQLVDEFVREFTAVVNRANGEAQGAIIAVQRELASVERDIAKLVQAIKAGVPGGLLKDGGASPAGSPRNTGRQDGQLRAPKPLLHPGKLRQLYYAWINETCVSLTDIDRHANAAAALRSMVESIVLTPEGGTLRVVVTGDSAVMLAAGYPKQQAAQRKQLSLVAGGI